MSCNGQTAIFTKDPDAVLDYVFDWSAWLGVDGDEIDTHLVIPETGITLESSTQTPNSVKAWVSGGTSNVTYKLTCRITTVGGRTDDRTAQLFIMNQ